MNLRTRSPFLISFIGFLILTALLGIRTMLVGDFGTMQLKILATTFSISAASICAMACAAFIQRRGMPLLGWTGIAVNFAAAATLIFGMWTKQDTKIFWKLVFTLVVLGLGFAHSLLLQLPRLSDKVDWLQPVAAGMVAILALMINVGFWAEIDYQGYYRLLAVASIIVALLTLVIPIMMKLHKPEQDDVAMPPDTPAPKGALTLTPINENYYKDAGGAVYRVEKVPDSATK